VSSASLLRFLLSLRRARWRLTGCLGVRSGWFFREFVVANPHLVRLYVPEAELVVFADGRAIVKGTADAARARSIYARYVGA